MKQKTNNLYRLQKNKIIAGVVGGLAMYLGVHPAWLRFALLGFVFGAAFMPHISAFVLVAYFVAALAVPVVPEAAEPNFPKLIPLERDHANQMLTGVCAGLAKATILPLWLIRLGFVLMGFTGVGVAAYVLLLLFMG